MPQRVLYTTTHTVSGSILMPNGLTDYNRIGVGATGPGWAATTSISIRCANCSVGFASNGPESGTGSFSTLTAGVQLGEYTGAPGASLTFAGTYAPGYTALGPSDGRGNFGDTVSGSFSFSVPSQLVVETYGEPDIEIPDDAYPSYGGTKTVGEFPSNYAILKWIPVPGSSVSGSVTLGDRSASTTAPSDLVAFSENVSFTLSMGHAPIDGTGQPYRPYGTITASLNFDGYPITSTGAAVTFESTNGTGTAMTGQIGAGYAKATIETNSEGIPSGSVGGISLQGDVYCSRIATVELDAMAMDQPHPHACEWMVLDTYIGVVPPAPGDTYGTILDPPEPVWHSFTGQSISVPIDQRREALLGNAFNKSVGPKVRSSSCEPATGTVNGFSVTYDHYRNEQGRVMSYLIPPPGEDVEDWRVGFRGREFAGLNVGHDASLTVPLSGSSSGSDTLYGFDPPFVMEGYRFASVVSDGDATAVQINGKIWSLSATTDPQTIDLCFPSGGGPWFDRQDTRFPLDADRLSTIETSLWGITHTTQIKAVGGALTSFVLQEGAAGTKVHALAPFLPFDQEVPDDELTTGGGDTYTVEHYCATLIKGDVDGRQGHQIPHVRKTVNNAPGRLYTDDYEHLSISSLPALFVEIPGWLASSASLEDGDQAAWFLGHGYTVSNGVWTKGFDHALGTLKGQPLYDSLEWPGDVRTDVFTVGGSGLRIKGRKVLRSSAYGAIRGTATVYYSSLPDGDEGTAAVAGKRYGLTGPTLSDSNAWGRVWTDPAHKASFGGVPRLIERGAFDVPVNNPGAVHLARSLDDGAILLTRSSEDGQVSTKTLNLGGDPIEGAVGEGDSGQSYIHPGEEGYYACFRSKDGQTVESRSYDQGATWSDESPMIPGTNPAVAVNESSGEEFVSTWTDPGWDVYARLPGEDDFTIVSHIADGPEKQAGLTFDPTQDGALWFAYDNGSETQLMYSRNQGQDWTTS